MGLKGGGGGNRGERGVRTGRVWGEMIGCVLGLGVERASRLAEVGVVF